MEFTIDILGFVLEYLKLTSFTLNYWLFVLIRISLSQPQKWNDRKLLVLIDFSRQGVGYDFHHHPNPNSPTLSELTNFIAIEDCAMGLNLKLEKVEAGGCQEEVSVGLFTSNGGQNKIHCTTVFPWKPCYLEQQPINGKWGDSWSSVTYNNVPVVEQGRNVVWWRYSFSDW